MIALPLVLYPTTLLWVDDDELFLHAVTEGFKKNFDIQTCTSPKECVALLQKYQSSTDSLPFLRGSIEHEEYDLNDHFPVDIDFNSILNLSADRKRQNDISVIIIDYHMPNMTGIELCNALRGLPIKKILLTGEANHHQAIAAFNEGTIDRFIRKDELMLAKNLLTHIQKLNLQYFTDITRPWLSHLEADYKLPQSDPVFVDFFNSWCGDQHVSEYYLIDKNGTYLTIDEQGRSNYFVIHTERTLKVFTELYSNDKEASLFVRAVRQRNKIPYFGLKKDSWDFETQHWGNYFYSPHVLDGRERYFWAVIENNLPWLDRDLRA